MLQTPDAAKSLAGNILTTKSVRFQTEYIGRRKSKVTLHGVPLFISEGHLGVFFSKFGEVADVSMVNGKTGNTTGDIEIMVTGKRKKTIWTFQIC